MKLNRVYSWREAFNLLYGKKRQFEPGVKRNFETGFFAGKVVGRLERDLEIKQFMDNNPDRFSIWFDKNLLPLNKNA